MVNTKPLRVDRGETEWLLGVSGCLLAIFYVVLSACPIRQDLLTLKFLQI